MTASLPLTLHDQNAWHFFLPGFIPLLRLVAKMQGNGCLAEVFLIDKNTSACPHQTNLCLAHCAFISLLTSALLGFEP